MTIGHQAKRQRVGLTSGTGPAGTGTAATTTRTAPSTTATSSASPAIPQASDKGNKDPNSVSHHVSRHGRAVSNLLSTISAIASTTSSSDPATVADLLQESAVHFLTLKSTQRAASLLLEGKMEEVRRRTEAAEAGHLVLQNLAYERAHLLREIRGCRDCPTRELERMARDEVGGSGDGDGRGGDGAGDKDDEEADDGDSSATGGDTPTPSVRGADEGGTGGDGDTATASSVLTRYLGVDVDEPRDRTSHQAVLDFLSSELEARGRLEGELEGARSERAGVEAESESKRRFLSSLPDQLDVLEKATLPLQKYLKLRSSERRARFARAGKLCRPLYILCCQLEAYADAFGGAADDGEGESDMVVEVADAVQHRPSSPSSSRKLAAAASGDGEEEVDVEEGEEGEEGEDREEDGGGEEDLSVSSSAKARRDEEDAASPFRSDPLAVLLRLRPPRRVNDRQHRSPVPPPRGDATTTIRFQYLPCLNVVTAEAVGNPTLLINLFPNDTGEGMPNLSSYHTLSSSDGVDGFDGFPEDFPGRPYMWAQWLAGLAFLGEGRGGGGGGANERLEPSTRSVIRQMRRRVRANRVLRELLATLTGRPNPIPVHPAMCPDPFPTAGGGSGGGGASGGVDGGAALSQWVEVPASSKVRSYFGQNYNARRKRGQTDGDISSEESHYACRYFFASVQRRNDTLKAMVEISPEYPARAPRWLLQTPPPGEEEPIANSADLVPLHDNNLGVLEGEVNAEYSDLVKSDVEETFDWILVHQLRKIISCWGALRDGPDHGSIAGVRVRRGRDRRKTLAFHRYAKAKK